MRDDNDKSGKTAGDAVQLAGLVLLGIGCALEIVNEGGIWLVGIAVGSILFTIGTKLKGR